MAKNSKFGMPPDFEMPADMGAFAEASMKQARVAFDSWVSATRQVVNAAQNQALTAQSGGREMSELAMRFAERNIEASFQFASKLIQTKDPTEMAALHSEYMQAQMEALKQQAEEFRARASKLGMPK